MPNPRHSDHFHCEYPGTLSLTPRRSCSGKGAKGYTVQVLGDEFLETPLFSTAGLEVAFAKLVNDRQRRNWEKIGRFEAAMRAMTYR